jgi:CheY-like chemotaxis protein
MIQGRYEAQQLSELLKFLRSRRVSGTLRLAATINARRSARSCFLVWQKGEITYAGSDIPNKVLLAQKLLKRVKPKMSEQAIAFARNQVQNPHSVREFFEIFTKIRLLTWEKVETYLHAQAVITIELFLPYGGQFQFDPVVTFDLTYGQAHRSLNWSKLIFDVARRRQEWKIVTPIVPFMDAIPQLPQTQSKQIPLATVRQHLQRWVDGKRSLVEIAQRLDRDPLQIARIYRTWAQMGWVVFAHSSHAQKKNLPTILSVDDNPFIQIAIEKALQKDYNVLLASNAVDGLNLLLLNQKPVQLLLLDITLPDLDGLEMCRTVRSIEKYSNLPIVMLTAKDTLVDKMKGIIAGTNRYLTKPFEEEKLLKVVGEFIRLGKT